MEERTNKLREMWKEIVKWNLLFSIPDGAIRSDFKDLEEASLLRSVINDIETLGKFYKENN